MKIDVTIRGLAACLCVSACALFAACGTETAPTNNAAATNTGASTTSRNANATGTTSAANAPAGDEGTPAQQQAVKDVDAALKKAGFTNIRVFLKSNTIQIKGTVPPGKLKEAQDTARNAAGMNATMIEIYQENPK